MAGQDDFLFSGIEQFVTCTKILREVRWKFFKIDEVKFLEIA